MRNLKKFLALVLAMMMVMGLMVTANAATSKDAVDGNQVKAEYREAIDVMVALGIVSGTDSSVLRINPKDTFTRAEFANQLYKLVGGGSEVEKVLKDFGKNDQIFTDVKPGAWYTEYVNYAYNKGLVAGRGDGTYDPDGEVAVTDVLVVMLKILGIKADTSQSYTLGVISAAVNADLTASVTDALNGKATREQAFQILFNAAKKSPTGEKEYVVTCKEDNYNYTFSSETAASAAFGAHAGHEGADLKEQASSKDSVLDKLGVKPGESTDASGHTTKGWVVNGEVIGAAETADNAIVYNTKMNAGDAEKDLADRGITKTNGSAQVIRNGYRDGDFEAALNSTGTDGIKTVIAAGDHASTKLSVMSYLTSSNNTTVEVYVNADKEITKVIAVNTFMQTLIETDIVAATDTDPAHILLHDTWGSSWDANFTVNDNGPGPKNDGAKWNGEYKVGDIILYTRGQNAKGEPVITSAQKATYITGKITARENASPVTYVYIDGVKYNIGDEAGNIVDNSAAWTPSTTATDKAYYLDTYRNIIAATDIPVTTTDPGDTTTPVAYAYVLEYVAEEGTLATLLSAGTPARAVAKVLDPVTGAVSTVNIAVAQADSGEWQYADNTGKANGTKVETTKATDNDSKKGYYTCVSTALGYVLTEVATSGTTGAVQPGTNGFNIAKENALITFGSDNLVANENTTVVVLTKNADGTYTPATYTGYKNFPTISSAKATDVMYVRNTDGIVTTVYITAEPAEAAEPDPTTYAIYLGTGDITADGIPYRFQVNGAEETYFAADNSVVFTDSNKGTVYTLSFNNKNQITAADTPTDTGTAAGVKVNLVTASFVQADEVSGTVYYLADGYVVYDKTAANPALTLAKGVTVTMYAKDAGKAPANDNPIVLVVITAPAPAAG